MKSLELVLICWRIFEPSRMTPTTEEREKKGNRSKCGNQVSPLLIIRILQLTVFLFWTNQSQVPGTKETADRTWQRIRPASTFWSRQKLVAWIWVCVWWRCHLISITIHNTHQTYPYTAADSINCILSNAFVFLYLIWYVGGNYILNLIYT